MAAQRLPAAFDGAGEMTVAFNPAYLTDALSSFEDATVRMRLLGPGQRAMISGEGAGPSAHEHLLMSVKPSLL